MALAPLAGPPSPPLNLIDGVPEIELLLEEGAVAGAEVGALEFFPVVVVLGMLAAAAAWLRPQFQAQTHQHHSLLYRAVTWPAARLLKAVHTIEHRITHAMSHWLSPKVRILTHWLNSVTHLQHTLSQALGDLADNTHEALTYLRHHVVPELIREALQPIRARLKDAEDLLDTTLGRLRTAADEIADQLAEIGKTVGRTFTGAIGALAATVVELWRYVHEDLPDVIRAQLHTALEPIIARVEVVEQAITETIPAEFDALRDRLKKLEDYIVSAAFIALVVAAVERALSFLTCRNMKKFGNEACVAEELVMDSLTALMFGALVLSNLRELTHFAQSVEGEITDLVEGALH